MSETKELVVSEKNTTLIGSQQRGDFKDVIAYASDVATALQKIVDDKQLFSMISGKKYMRVEAWTTLLALLGVTPREVTQEGRALEDGGFEAVVELVRSDGTIMGKASSICGDSTDKTWFKRPKAAQKSMAITRATSKAARLAFSWIAVMAGYDPTPFEEMDGVVEGSFVEHPPVDVPEYSFRTPECHEHGSEPVPLVWKEGDGEKGHYAFWGCPHYQDAGCRTASNAPGPAEQDMAEMYWRIVDLAAKANTDMSSSVVEAGFTKALLGEATPIKALSKQALDIVEGYWSIVAAQDIKLPEWEELSKREYRKALAKAVTMAALENDMSFLDAYDLVFNSKEAGEMVFAEVKDGKHKTLVLAAVEDLAE